MLGLPSTGSPGGVDGLNRGTDAVIPRTMSASQQWASRNSIVYLAYLGPLCAPQCDQEALRMMVDLFNWLSMVTPLILSPAIWPANR